MERADLLYSGLMLTALILSLWTCLLLGAVCCWFASALFGHALSGLRANSHELRSSGLQARKHIARSS